MHSRYYDYSLTVSSIDHYYLWLENKLRWKKISNPRRDRVRLFYIQLDTAIRTCMINAHYSTDEPGHVSYSKSINCDRHLEKATAPIVRTITPLIKL